MNSLAHFDYDLSILHMTPFYNYFLPLNMQELGVDLPKEIIPNSATLKYTDFLMASASGNVQGVKSLSKLATPFEKTKLAAYTLGAMTPCMRLYAFLGEELFKLLNPDDGLHPYQKWIDNYYSDNYQVCITNDKI